MSYVYSYIIVGFSLDDPGECEPLRQLNALLSAHGTRAVEFVQPPGPGKALEIDVWLIAGNYLGPTTMASFMRHCSWPKDGRPQLFVSEPDGSHMTEVPWMLLE